MNEFEAIAERITCRRDTVVLGEEPVPVLCPSQNQHELPWYRNRAPERKTTTTPEWSNFMQ
jgi:hypothetical protein